MVNNLKKQYSLDFDKHNKIIIHKLHIVNKQGKAIFAL
jgi:hypothetical protein